MECTATPIYSQIRDQERVGHDTRVGDASQVLGLRFVQSSDICL
jgi:hypothetical protein